jgi:hypothetical protein
MRHIPSLNLIEIPQNTQAFKDYPQDHGATTKHIEIEKTL